MLKDCQDHSAQPAATLGLDAKFIEQLAIQTDLIRRKTSRFSATGFLLSLLQAVGSGQASLNQLCMSLARHQPRALSKQGMAYHLNESAVAFMEGLLSKLSGSSPSMPGGDAAFPAHPASGLNPDSAPMRQRSTLQRRGQQSGQHGQHQA